MEPGRPTSAVAFLPSRAPPPGRPALPGCVALVEELTPHSEDQSPALARGLAAKFGGLASDYKVAPLSHRKMAVFFPNWVARESAIA